MLKSQGRSGSALQRTNVPESPRRAALFLFSMLILPLLWTGCAATPALPPGFQPPEKSRIITGVPFHAQEDYQCGPAALASVLNFHGDPVTPEAIAGDIFRPGLRATVTLDLVLYARSRGFPAQWFSGRPEDIVRAVDRNRPLVVMLDYGWNAISKNHFLVLFGYSPQGVIVHDGRRRDKLIPWNDFLPPWLKAGGWTMAVEPR